ncbi:facilitated trehalose transporter tret1-2 -like protein [Holotrichia oblita]|uniref:Facilitated trehalose transporter tret1-2 -like protein n=1 Tax=Holotrichia oblita TaxID=644536 RepID=A0ACB9SI32_HOLOL|nr:facilitated trehalose transporter tret1-2 -like protein [Holotrichia oblita]
MDIGNAETALAIEKEKKQDAQFKEIIASCTSLSHYESRRFVTLVPQIIATLIAGSFHIVLGISSAYSAVLIPQLRNTTILGPAAVSSDNSTSNITINATNTNHNLYAQKEAWVASTTIVVIPIASLICGVFMDSLGRLNTLKLTAIPVTIGWILIATATNYPMLLLGRILTGIVGAFGTSPAMVYLTEIARADMRGSLTSCGPSYTSLGMVLAYLKGWFMDWRTIAWVSTIYTIVPCVLMFFIPESPAWYISKGKIDQARKSLEWIHKYQPQPPNKTQSMAELHLAVLIRDHEKKQEELRNNKYTGLAMQLKEFTKPTAIKPLIMLLLLFFIQQFSGIYITLFYAIDFFKQMGNNMNPYLASIFLGTVRFCMSMVNTYMLKRFKRRALVMCSCIGMALCMLVSGLFTKWTLEGTTSFTWVPIVCLIFYVITSMMGLLPIPWIMTAELFPLEIRGMAQSISYGTANILMFLAVQSYPSLANLLGGVVHTQWFFAAICLIGLVYVFVSMPETHGKKLNDIVEYFVHNTFYITSQKTDKQESDRKPIVKKSRVTKYDLENSSNGQSKNLIVDD